MKRTASHLYRIAQEALTNAARHGHATAVEIFLLVDPEHAFCYASPITVRVFARQCRHILVWV